MADDVVIGLQADFLTPTATTSNTENALLPATNALDAHNPGRVFRGTGAAASEWIKFDFGASVTLSGILLDNSNITAIEVDGSLVDSFPTGVSEIDVDLIDDPLQPGRAKGFVDLRGTGYETAARWIRIRPRNGTTNDGTSTWAIGGITFLDAVQSFEASGVLHNPSAIEVIPLRAVTRIPLSNGGRYIGTRGLPRMQVAFSAASIAPTGYTVWGQLLGQLGKDLVWWRNHDGAVGECYRCDIAIVGGLSERYVAKAAARTVLEEVA